MKEQRSSTQIAQFFRSNRRKRNWRKAVTSMAAVVVFCVTYALILPAITMEASPVCGLEEHTHTEECYEIVRTLVCENTDEDHVHTEECWKVEQKPVCGLEEHIHTEACYAKETESYASGEPEAETEEVPVPEAEPLKEASAQEPVVRSAVFEGANGFVYVEGKAPAGTPEELALEVVTLEDKDTEAERTALGAVGVDLSAEGTRVWFFMPKVSHAGTQVTLSGPVSVRLRLNGVSAANDPHVYVFSAGNAELKEIVLGEDGVISFTADALGRTALVYKETSASEPAADPTPEVTPEPAAEPTPEVTPAPTAEPAPEATPATTEAPAGTPAPTEAPAAAEEEAEISEYSFTFEDPSAYLSNILKLSGAKLKGEYAEISVEPAGLVYLDKRDEQIKTGLFGLKKLGEEQLLTAVTSFDRAALILKTENEEVRIDLHNPKTEADFVPFTGEANGISVFVQASAGALPEGTEMLVLPVNDEKLLNIAGSAVDGEVKNIVAVDISFWNDGEEIEPILPVQVKLSSDFIRAASDPQIVHVPDKGTVEVITTDTPDPGANDITFASKTFSVYAVVETGDDGDNARATVNFYGKDTSTPIATVFVKNSDDYDAATDTGKLKDIVYDPGNGELESTELFDGWSISTINTTDGKEYALKDDEGNEIKGKTIEDVRKYLAELKIEEGNVVNIYARIVKYYTVTYIGETPGVVLGSETQKLLQADSTTDYTVNMAYTPATNTQNFDGWLATQGSSNISQAVYGEEAIATPYTTSTLFPNGTTMKLSGNVQFSVSAPAGHWLVFDENGKGATYNAPQFVKDGAVTKAPALDMVRLGYTFGGWYTDEDCTEGNEFSFGSTLSDNITIYAKWTQAEEANYTVIIWKESMTDTYANNGGTGEGKTKNYDFAESVQLSGPVGTVINTVLRSNSSPVTDGDDAGTVYYNAVVNGSTKEYKGYHCASIEENIEIGAEGNTVLNVYYDRNTVTYTFYTYGPYDGQWWLCKENGDHIIADGQNAVYETEIAIRSGNSYERYTGPVSQGDGRTYYYSTTGACTGTSLREAHWEYITNSGWNVYQESVGLYGETLNWPTDTSIWWYEDHDDTSGTGTRMTYKSAFLPLGSDMTVEYYGTNGDGNAYIHFWTQNADGTNYTDQQQVATGGSNKSFYINDKFTGFYAYQYRTDNGNWQNVGALNEGIYGDAVPYDARLDIRYNRIKGVITFLDGSYFDGNNNLLEETRKGDAYLTSPEYYYQADISSYNSDGDDYYTPDPYHSEYTFAGWYADDACTVPYNFTTMPATGATVYAKWILNQYRVFLHPNAGTDPTLDWGSDDQDMNFRVSSGSKVSAPTGTRLEYEFIGWYLDEACTQVFSADNFVLNETTVTAPYDKTDPANYTDPMDKWGNNATSNSDATGYNGGDRFWITKKFDLYAKWRAVLVGADGIGVVYDLNGGSGSVSDTNLYPDNTKAIAQGAATPADNTQQFLYWVVQEWDEDANNGEGAYADTDTHVYPGANYTVLKSFAKDVLEGTDSSGKEIHSYTMHLRAQYGPKEEATPTHITWYDNFTENPVEGTNYITDTELQINEAVDIEPADRFTRPGYKFLGWARVNTTKNDGTALDPAYELAPRNLTADDLFLVYDEEENAFTYNGTAVTQVAADEVFPYHDLYAVWEAKTYTVTVKKAVIGLAGDDEIPFAFTPSFEGMTGSEYSDEFRIVAKDGGSGDYGDSKVFNEIPYETAFSITEELNENFDTIATYTVTGADKEADNTTVSGVSNGATITVKGDTVLTVINTRKIQKVRIIKTDIDGTTPLGNAVFSANVGGTDYTLTSDGTDGYLKNEAFRDGVLTIPYGTYQLTEDTAPDGYIPLTSSVEITVNSRGVSALPYEVKEPTDTEECYVVVIPNNPGAVLPYTGGFGTAWIYTLGIVLTASAGVMLILKRRKHVK